MCYFNQNVSPIELEQIAEKSKNTTLTEWFKSNQIALAELQNPNVSTTDKEFYKKTLQLKYHEFSDLYVWNKSQKMWTKRKKMNNTLSRIYFVPANDSEQFYLRVLLTHVRGATSFNFLKTVNNNLYSTYKEACIENGLLVNDSLYFKCLNDAKEMKSGKKLRNLFCLILIYNIVQQPFELWNSFKNEMCDDFLYDLKKKSRNHNLVLNEEIENRALIEIEYILSIYNRSIDNQQGKWYIENMQININQKYFILEIAYIHHYK